MTILRTLAAVLLLACTAYSADGTLSGTLRTPQSGVPISNATLTLTLNQSGVVAGSAALSATNAVCATSTTGAIVGIKNPLTAPALSTSSAGGSLSGSYYVKVAYYSGSGVSLASAGGVITVTGPNNTIVVSAPAAVTGATGYKVYASATSGSETLQATTVGFVSNTSLTSLTSGTALPTTNTTTCTLTFNDSIIPTSTKYRVSLTDSRGAAVPGFPFFVYLQGTSVDVSNGWPTARDVETRYFTPVVSSPLSNATQSVNSPLTLNGYRLTAGVVELPNNSAPPATSTGRTFIYTDASGTAKVCENGSACVALVGGTYGWVDGGNTVRLVSTTDMALSGGTASDLAGTATGNGSIISRNAIGVADGATNAHFAGIVPASGAFAIASGVTGTQTTGLPITFRTCPSLFTDCSSLGTTEFGRLEVGGRWILHGTTSDYPGGAVLVNGIFTALSDTVNAVAAQISATSTTMDIISTSTGTRPPKPMQFWTGGNVDPGVTLKLTVDHFAELDTSYSGGTLSASGTTALRNNSGTLQVSNNGGAWGNVLTSASGIIPVSNGGTGNSSAWTDGGVLFASSTTTTATASTMLFDSSAGALKTTLLAPSVTTPSPATGKFLLVTYSSGADYGLIRSYDFGAATYKALEIGSTATNFSISGTTIFGVTSTAPKWYVSTNATAGAVTLSLASTTFPGSVGGIPYTWLKVVAADGTTVWVPAYK